MYVRRFNPECCAISVLLQMFARGVGTQVMHKKQKVGATSSHHMMMELARNVLDGGELKTFSYYLNQYENERIGVEDLVTALLRLLDTDEKVHTVHAC